MGALMTVRAFLGLPLPEAYQQELERLRKRWQYRLRSRLTWTRPGNWHITLKFLGDTQEAAVPRIQEALECIRWEAFSLKGASGGFFPPAPANKPPRPRVVWVGLGQGARETAQLAGAVETALAPLGIPAEDREFRAHLTLARVKQAVADDAWGALLQELHALEWPVCAMDRFVLWKSVLGPGGPAYTPLTVFTAKD